MEHWNDLPIKEREAGSDIYGVYPYFARFFAGIKKTDGSIGRGASPLNDRVHSSRSIRPSLTAVRINSGRLCAFSFAIRWMR